jgi:glycosyltransferase involved in cell wall biosynthesis
MKLAIVHDWIVDVGGAERVLIALHRLWPDAPIYTLLYKPATVRAWLPDATIIASRLQRIPLAWRIYPWLAPLMPSAIESFDLSGYDTVLSSSVLFSKGVVVRPGTRHLCYCYSPARMLWDSSSAYTRFGRTGRVIRHVLRTWDSVAARRPDQMIAISQTVADRIATYYRRESIVVPPPTRQVSGVRDQVLEAKTYTLEPEYYLVVSRMVPHKSLDVVTNAFAKLRHRLVIVGDGPLRARLQHRAPHNITFTGWVSDETLDGLYDHCRAVIVPNEEDWGLTAIEAMAHGKPVLALRSGGATESVIEGVTGEFFDDAIPEALADGMKRLRANLLHYDPAQIRARAAQYGPEQFEQRMRTLVERPC